MKALGILFSILTAINCGFAADELPDTVIYQDTPDTYNGGNCYLTVHPIPIIDDEYGHYKEDKHGFFIEAGNMTYSSSGWYRGLNVKVPCSECWTGDSITGFLAVYDDHGHIYPYGWGQQRPPMKIPTIDVTYSKNGATLTVAMDAEVLVGAPFPMLNLQNICNPLHIPGR